MNDLGADGMLFPIPLPLIYYSVLSSQESHTPSPLLSLSSSSSPPLPPSLPTDFLPLFVWVLVQCGFHRAEIEAEYMWGLAHPSLFNGEAGYYLTTLTSAGEQMPVQCLILELHGLGMGHYVYQRVPIGTGWP